MNAALFYKLMAIREKRLPLWLECASGAVSIGMYDNPKRADVQYSLDGGTWQDIADTQIPLVAGQRAYFRQKPLLNSTVYTGPAPGQNWDYGAVRNPDRNIFMNFTMSGEGTVKAGGNIHSMYDYKNGEQVMSQYQLANLFHSCAQLVQAPELPDKALTDNCYMYMFYGCTSLTVAPELPAMTLAVDCYNSMFMHCTNLAVAPVLPATVMANSCYKNMLRGCTSLVQPPALPATKLHNSCYSDMFNGCTSLTSAPALPATTLTPYCYWYMFNGCKSLTTAPALPATVMTNYCYNNMFNGCASLVNPPALPSTQLAQNCYGAMFQGCTSLEIAPALPATELAESCYGSMFQDCTELKTPPALPATKLALACYAYMFWRCRSLESMPELPATTLADSCYLYMFRECNSLTGSIPALPATELATGCYAYMFNGCNGITGHVDLPGLELKKDCYRAMFWETSITSMSVAFTDWHDGEGDEINGTDLGNVGATMNMLNGVPAGGTFTKPATLPDKRGLRYVPESWTVKSIMPTDGMVFYMPMKDTITKAIVNGAEVKSAEYFTNANDVSFTTDSNIPCTYFNGNTWLCNLPVVASEYTMTLWFKPQVKTLTDGTTTSHYAVYYPTTGTVAVTSDGSTNISWGGSSRTASADTWHFLACKYSLEGSYVRVDDVTGSKGSSQAPLNNDLSIAGGGYVNIMYGQLQTNGNEFKGYMAGLRIFNRVLSDAEIEALRHEFTPTE